MIKRLSKISILGTFFLLTAIFDSTYVSVALANTGYCNSQNCAANRTCFNMRSGGSCQVGVGRATGASCNLTRQSTPGNAASWVHNLCISGYCSAAGGQTSGVCQSTALEPGKACAGPDECASGQCSVAAQTGTLGVCGALLATNAACTTNTQCQTGICLSNVCRVLGATNAACTANTHCQSGMCFSGKCITLGTGNTCTINARCQSNRCVSGACAA